MQKKNAEKQAMEDTKSDIGWGSQIRSYVPLTIPVDKDLRTGVETCNTQAGTGRQSGSIYRSKFEQGYEESTCSNKTHRALTR